MDDEQWVDRSWQPTHIWLVDWLSRQASNNLQDVVRKEKRGGKGE